MGVVRPAHAALFGQEAADAMRAWRAEVPDTFAHVFVGFRGRGSAFADDAPIATKNVWAIVTETAQVAGVGHVKPHDLRRTLATELLETGAPVHHVQQQLGHANAQTTLQNYTSRVDAGARRRSGRVRYG